MNENVSKLYKKFIQTGKINDYLVYVKEKKNNSDVRRSLDGKNRRNSDKFL